tara:strand:+ start:68050 stop:68766 length:717 start_codon:yes stop_codon:yes gene_type:complete
MHNVSQRLTESSAKQQTATYELDPNGLETAHFILDVSAGAGAATAATGTITFATVLAGDTVTINGLVYTAVAGAKADNTQFSINGTDIVDAADLVDSITNDVRAGVEDFSAANGGTAVVTITAEILVQSPTEGNAITLVSSNGTRLAVSGGGTLTGGVDGDSVTLTIDAYNPASKTWYNILTGAAISTNITTIYRIGLDYIAVANLTVADIIPRIIRVVVTKSNASPVTYSIGINGVE